LPALFSEGLPGGPAMFDERAGGFSGSRSGQNDTVLAQCYFVDYPTSFYWGCDSSLFPYRNQVGFYKFSKITALKVSDQKSFLPEAPLRQSAQIL